VLSDGSILQRCVNECHIKKLPEIYGEDGPMPDTTWGTIKELYEKSKQANSVRQTTKTPTDYIKDIDPQQVAGPRDIWSGLEATPAMPDLRELKKGQKINFNLPPKEELNVLAGTDEPTLEAKAEAVQHWTPPFTRQVYTHCHNRPTGNMQILHVEPEGKLCGDLIEEAIPDIRNAEKVSDSGVDSLWCDEKRCLDENERLKALSGVPTISHQIETSVVDQLLSEAAKCKHEFDTKMKMVFLLLEQLGRTHVQYRENTNEISYMFPSEHGNTKVVRFHNGVAEIQHGFTPNGY